VFVRVHFVDVSSVVVLVRPVVARMVVIMGLDVRPVLMSVLVLVKMVVSVGMGMSVAVPGFAMSMVMVMAVPVVVIVPMGVRMLALHDGVSFPRVGRRFVAALWYQAKGENKIGQANGTLISRVTPSAHKLRK
jgi:hypothetical protein